MSLAWLRRNRGLRVREVIADFKAEPWTVFATCPCGRDRECEVCFGLGVYLKEVTPAEFTMTLLEVLAEMDPS